MNKTTRNLFIVFFILLANYSFSQNISVAKAYYTKARESFENDNFTQTIEYLGGAKQELGTTNPDIIFLEVSSRFNMNKKDMLIEPLAKEFIEKSDETEDRERIRKVSLMIVEHKEAVQAAQKEESDAYQEAIFGKNVPAIRTFIEKYPNNANIENVKIVLAQAENKYYNDAIAKDEVAAYQEYLKYFETGKYQTEITSKLKIAEEKAAYQAVLGNKTTASCQAYLKSYPEGKYKNETLAILEEILFNEGNSYLQNGDLTNARNRFQSYKSYLPNGKNIPQVEKNLKTIDKKTAREEAIQSRTSCNYFMLPYNTNGAFGFEFGKLHEKNLSVYFNMTGNENFTNLQLYNDYEITTPSDEIPSYLKTAFITASFGFTFKVAYPVWLYLGGGTRYQEYYKEEESLVYSYKVNDENNFSFFPEAGLKLKVGKAIVLKSGIQYMDSQTSYQFGIGIQTRNWK